MTDIETTATARDSASAGASTTEIAPASAPIGAENAADTPSIGQRIRAARETRAAHGSISARSAWGTAPRSHR